MSLRMLWCFQWTVSWPSALLAVLHGGVCCYTLYPRKEYIFIAGCEYGIANITTSHLGEETCLHFCHERGGQVIHGLIPHPCLFHCHIWAAGVGNMNISPWSLVFTHNPTPKVDCRLSVLIHVFLDSIAEERLQRNYLQLRYCLRKLPSLHQI